MQNQLQNNYPAYAANLPGENIAWLHGLRAQAFAQFMQQGVPTIRSEAWKYTNLHRLNKPNYLLAVPTSPQIVIDTLPVFSETLRLIFVDGVFNPSLSTIAEQQLNFVSFRQALETRPELLQRSLQQVLGDTTSAFPALNTSMALDGAIIEIPAQVDAGIIEIVYYTTQQAETTLVQPRTIILCGEQSHATIIEHYTGEENTQSLTNNVTQIQIGKNAKVEHIKLQAEALKTDHLGQLFVTQQDASHFKDVLISCGANIARNEIHAVFAAEHATTELYGLFIPQKTQHMDQYTLIDHAASHCTSIELYRGILLDAARGVFNGRVMVQPHVKKSNAQQKNNNLLLSALAEMDTKPELQIYNDDVQCSHGATVGQLDMQALFYLRARGLSIEKAKNILLYGFATEILQQISNEQIRAKILQCVENYLPINI